MSSAAGAKRDRERLRQERATLKRARKQAPADASAEALASAPTSSPIPLLSQSDVLARLADLHQRFESGVIGFEDFEAARDELTGQLVV